MKQYISTPKERCEIVLYDFENPIKVKKFQKTKYVYYKCKFIKLNGQSLNDGNHIIQMPQKTCWLQLFDFVEQHNIRKEKNIHLWIVKKDNHNYIFSLGNTTLNTKHKDWQQETG